MGIDPRNLRFILEVSLEKRLTLSQSNPSGARIGCDIIHVEHLQTTIVKNWGIHLDLVSLESRDRPARVTKPAKQDD